MRLGFRQLLIAAACFLGAQSAMAAISGSKHDMTSFASGGTGYTDQVCKYCHTPHNALQNVPLWNRATPAPAGGYTIYSSPTMNAATGQPGASSKMCLSCHDGSIATDSYAGVTTGSKPIPNTNAAYLGTTLDNDHPIGMAFPLVSADPWFNAPFSADWVDSGKSIPLFTSKVECASCHAVHDTTNAPFLRMSNTGSALCKKCHTK